MADELKKELTITRIFDASRDLVWKAWTENSDIDITKADNDPMAFAKIKVRIGDKPMHRKLQKAEA